MRDHEKEPNTAVRAASLRGLIAAALILCVAIILMAGWLGKNDSREASSVAHMKARSTTGSR